MASVMRYAGYGASLLAVPLIATAVPAIAGHDLPELPYYLMLVAAALASVIALALMRSPAYDRRMMLCLALGLGCWAAGMANGIANSGTDENAIIDYVIFVAYGLPLLYAAVANPDEPTTTSRRIIDAILLVLLVLLCYLGVENLQDGHGLLRAEYVGSVATAFDVENIFLFVVFLIRTLACENDRDYRFFRITTLFLGVYAIAAALHNHDSLYPSAIVLQRLTDSLPAIAFVLLASLLLAERHPGPVRRPHYRWARMVVAGYAPGVLLSAIFALSIGIRQAESTVGNIALALAMLIYVIRVAQTQFFGSWLPATASRRRYRPSSAWRSWTNSPACRTAVRSIGPSPPEWATPSERAGHSAR
ncbi:hypothetical protein L2Y96_19120 [Luteibacter aegosomaticola]|uniref:hypothetical protein n=1 Tax=Luteibacter aegosomaticola TaxID=2911538 RepID=UPI001FF98513|nr:hypothetical protein [Luteibacter aegosomaticola]UPG89484.1 hypothetical protein L2Y96_19120 [Luteibacter aegosomaticola]